MSSVGPLFASLLGEPPPCESRESANRIPERIEGPAANPANPANPTTEIRKLAGFARVPRFTRDLQARIRAMAARWQYAPDELTEALECAAADPAAWLAAVELDEEFMASARRVGRKYPC